jgi:GNAT superfamily N-acetyltransferase
MAEYQIDTCTPNNVDISNPILKASLKLIRRGVLALRNMDGIENTLDELGKYSIYRPSASHETPVIDFPTFWNNVTRQGRTPFLLAAHVGSERVVGALEGRKYVYNAYASNTPAIFVNWVVTEEHYQRQGIATALYERVQDMARRDDIKLLIAGINTQNRGSERLHEKIGFIKESPAEELPTAEQIKHPFKTARGVYIPGYEIDGVDSKGQPINGFKDVWTKWVKR